MHVLTKYLKQYQKEVILGPLFKLLEACFELITPLVLARIVDTIIPHSNQGDLVAMILFLMFLALCGVGIALLAQYYSARAAVGCTRELTKDLYAKVLSLPKRRQDQLSSASLFTRLSSDTLQIQTGINTFLRLFLRAPIVVFGSFIMAFTIQPRLSVLFLGMILLLFFFVSVISFLSSRFYHGMRLQLDRLVALVRETTLGMRVIRSFGQSKRELHHFKDQNQTYQQQQNRAAFWANLLTPVTFLIVNASLLYLLWTGQLAIQNNLLEQGMLIALINYLLQILTELIKMVMVIATLNQTAISFQRVQEIFEQASEEPQAALLVEKIADSSLVLEAQEVSLTYPGAAHAALEGVSLQLQAGEFLGIIGGTGAGKSTFLHLLLGFYPTASGKIGLYHKGKSPASLEEWRRWIALVPQNPSLFRGTVATNLTLGQQGVAEEKLWQALEIAQAASFLREKQGLETPVEAGGKNFSGGQRQRLTIARALVQDAPLLVLDDATSALDSLTEARLLKAIRQYFPEKSLILISQRTASVQTADQILVLDKGRQVGLGSHENLLETCPVYQEIATSQEKKEETPS